MTGNPKRRFVWLCIAVGALTPALTGVLARAWLMHRGLNVASWRESAIETLLPTAFIVLPLYLVFAAAASALLPSPTTPGLFRQRLRMALGGLIGLTVSVGGILYALFLEGGTGLLLLMLPAFLIVAVLGTLAGGGVGWLFDFIFSRWT